jgi:hypothetical protein
MSIIEKDNPQPYIQMRENGASPNDVFTKARADGYKNFECIILISEIFKIPLNEARTIAHSIYMASIKPPM